MRDRLQLVLLRSQSRRSAVHAWLSVLQAEAGQRLRAVPRRVWMVLSFAYLLRRHALALPSAVARREAAAERERIRGLIALPPRPMIGFDVGFSDYHDGAEFGFTFRSPAGVLGQVHPGAKPKAAIPAYAPDGVTVEPMFPPPASTWVLAPEASGAWCYYDTSCGGASWFPPEGSSSPTIRTLMVSEVLFADSPPPFDRQLTLGTVLAGRVGALILGGLTMR